MTQKDLLTNIKNYNQDEVIEDLLKISLLNFLLAAAKGKSYQDSWCKRGLFSISQNLERKTDRMQNQLFSKEGEILRIENLNLEGGDSFLDTLSDESNYCNLALVFFLQKSKNESMGVSFFNKFLEDQISFICDNLDFKEIKEILNVLFLKLSFLFNEIEFNGSESLISEERKFEKIKEVIQNILK